MQIWSDLWNRVAVKPDPYGEEHTSCLLWTGQTSLGFASQSCENGKVENSPNFIVSEVKTKWVDGQECSCVRISNYTKKFLEGF